MKITADFDKRILSLSGIISDIKQGRAAAFKETADLIKSNIKAELRSSNKTGAQKRSTRFRASPSRRSAAGESLARDTGASELLIDSDISSNTMEVGFKKNPKGFDYVAYQEDHNHRPTMELAIKKSLAEIERIFERNLTPK